MQDADDCNAVSVRARIDHVRATGCFPVSLANILNGAAVNKSLGYPGARRLDVPNTSNSLIATSAFRGEVPDVVDVRLDRW